MARVFVRGLGGATNWYAPSYNPATRLFYFLASENCDMYFLKPEQFSKGHTYYATGVKKSPGDAGKKILLAYELGASVPVWKYPQVGADHSSGGTMTTEGGIVFFWRFGQLIRGGRRAVWRAAVAFSDWPKHSCIANELFCERDSTCSDCGRQRYFLLPVALKTIS